MLLIVVEWVICVGVGYGMCVCVLLKWVYLLVGIVKDDCWCSSQYGVSVRSEKVLLFLCVEFLCVGR